MRPQEKITRREALRRVGMLMGGALAAPTVAGVLGGCGADPAPSWEPQVLSPEQNRLVTTISERIMPATDTPGAEAAQVNRFIDKMMADWYPADEREQFLSGLRFVDMRAEEAYGEAFLDLTPENQTALLRRMDAAVYGPAPPPAAEREGTPEDEIEDDNAFAQGQGAETVEEAEEPLRPDSAEADSSARPEGRKEEDAFFRRMKELTLLGYYTSEVGATEELRHQIAFPAYQGCVPYGPDDRTWA